MEYTIESLATLVEQQGQIIEQQGKAIANLQLKTASAIGTTISERKKSDDPTIPTELVTIGKDSYKWQVASFRLPGNNETFLAVEAALDDAVLKSIIAIDGQTILVKQA